MTDLSFDRRAALDGVRDIAPLMVPGIPFGLVLGLNIKESGIDVLAGWSSSWIIFGGASQLALVDLVGNGASAIVIIVSVALINARHLMYSAALRPRFADFPTWFRYLAPYFLIDQVFAITSASTQLEARPMRYQIWHYLGCGAAVFALWQAAVGLGVFVGDVVREDWSLNFAVPLLFAGLLALSIKDRPGLFASIVAGIVAVVARELPQRSGLLLAIVLGVAAGGLAESRLSNEGDA